MKDGRYNFLHFTTFAHVMFRKIIFLLFIFSTFKSHASHVMGVKLLGNAAEMAGIFLNSFSTAIVMAPKSTPFRKTSGFGTIPHFQTLSSISLVAQIFHPVAQR